MLDMLHETSSAACIPAVSMQYMSLLIMLAGVGAASSGSVAVPGPGTLLVTINYLPMMSSAHAVLPCHAGDCEEGEHFNLHF